MARYQNPLFTNAGAGALGGDGIGPRAYNFQTPVSGDPISSVAGAVTKFVRMATGGDPDFERARLYGAQRDQIEKETAGNKTLGSLISGWSDFSPEGIQRGTQQLASAAAEAGIKPEQAFRFVQGLVATNPGTSENSVARAVVAAGGGPLGKDQAYTTAGQSAIRQDNERQNVAEYTYREGQANTRQGMVTGEQQRYHDAALAEQRRQFNETPETVSGANGPQIVRRADAYGKSPVLNPTTAAPSSTIYFQPGDPRAPNGSSTVTAPARPENMGHLGAEIARLGVESGDQGKIDLGIKIARGGEAAPNRDPAKIPDLTPKALPGAQGKVLDPIYEEIRVQAGGEPKFADPAVEAAVRSRVQDLYYDDKSPAYGKLPNAVRQALGEVTQMGKPDTGWFGFSAPKTAIAGRQGAPAPATTSPAGGGAQAADPVAQARDAIARGANRDAVIARLKSLNLPIPPDL